MQKFELFDKKQQELAEIFRVLAHPARIAILSYLSESNTCISGDITDALPLSRTTVSQHISELKKVGLITGHYSGTKIYYCLTPEKINIVKQLICGYLSNLSESDLNCELDIGK